MKKSFLFLLVSIFTCSLFGQRLVQGTVIEEKTGEGLIGASIIIQGSSLGTVTDFDGHFQLEVPTDSLTLLVTYVGFSPKLMKVEAAKGSNKPLQLTIPMKMNSAALEEVVVTGYAAPLVEMDHSTSGMVIAKESAHLRGSRSKAKEYYVDGIAMSSDYAAPATSYAAPAAQAGMLTAGEVNDFQKWELWSDLREEDLATHAELWKLQPKQRYVVQLKTDDGFPVSGAKVKLKDKNGTNIWATFSDNTGKAELWANMTNKNENPDQIIVEYDQQTWPLRRIHSFDKGINMLSIPTACQTEMNIDIAFVVDATGSMSDEIEYLKAELLDVLQQVKDTLPDASLRLGSVFYRDKTDAYLTKKSDFSSNLKKTIDFIKAQHADGGGDTPEAVDAALNVAINGLQWNPNATTKLLYLVLDAPPHSNEEDILKMHQLNRLAAAKGIQIIPVACSGIDKSTEYLMRSIALSTNGSYLFLTDKSGIGNPHIEPSTDEYKERKFNDILFESIYNRSVISNCEQPIAATELLPADTLQVQMEGELAEKDPEHSISWKYFPNPTKGQVNIQVNGPVGALYLTDFSGKILERIQINEQKRLQIDIQQYPAGTYFLKYLYDDDQFLSGKLILVHS